MLKRLLINTGVGLLLLSGNCIGRDQIDDYHDALKSTCLSVNSDLPHRIVSNKTDLTDNFLASLSNSKQQEVLSRLFKKKSVLDYNARILKNDFFQNLNIIPELCVSNILQLMDRAETHAGALVLLSLSCNPISGLSVIENKQTLITFLLEHQEVFDRLNSLVKKVKEVQNALLNYWNEEINIDENLKSLIYVPKGSRLSFLNKSPIFHQFYKILLFSFGSVAKVMEVSMMIPAIFLPIGLAGSIFGQSHDAITMKNYLCVLVLLYISKINFNYIRLIHREIANMHQRLKSISRFTQSVDEIFYLIKNHEELFNGLSLISNINNFVLEPKAISKDLYYLKKFLVRPLFEQEKFALFSNAGIVVAAQAYMEDAKDDFILPLESIGELDAYLAIAKYIKDNQAKV